ALPSQPPRRAPSAGRVPLPAPPRRARGAGPRGPPPASGGASPPPPPQKGGPPPPPPPRDAQNEPAPPRPPSPPPPPPEPARAEPLSNWSGVRPRARARAACSSGNSAQGTSLSQKS